jgi:hypothetical protein
LALFAVRAPPRYGTAAIEIGYWFDGRSVFHNNGRVSFVGRRGQRAASSARSMARRLRIHPQARTGARLSSTETEDDMRTNPFFDSWLFITGSTMDHEKLGVLKYFFVVLFLALLTASLWIAWTNWREDQTQRTGVHVTTWLIRALIGCMWFQGCLWKLPLPISESFQYWTSEMKVNAAFRFHRELVETVYLPNLKIIDPLVFLAEISFAISLLLGIGVRMFALAAVAFSLHLWIGLYLHESEWPWNYVFLAMLHALFVAYAAGRSLGADALLQRRIEKTGLVRRFVNLVG